MKTFLDRLNNLSEIYREFLFEHSYSHMAQAGKRDLLLNRLTDIEFMDAKISFLGPNPLIRDFNVSFNYGYANEITKQYYNFLLQHKHRLVKHPKRLLFSLIQVEGFPEAKTQAEELVERGIWKDKWLQLVPVWMPQVVDPASTSEHLNVVTQWDWEYTPTSVLAKDRLLVFFLKQLGLLGIIDLNIGTELQDSIAIKPLRPLKLVCSDSGRVLVILYDNGVADLIQMSFDRMGELERFDLITTLNYIIPRYEAPVMGFRGNELWFQEEAGTISKFNVEDANYSKHGLFQEDQNIELSGFVPTSDKLFLTFRAGPDSYLGSTIDGESYLKTVIRGADVTALCGCDDNVVAIAFSNRKIIFFDISNVPELLYTTDITELPVHMVWTEKRLIWISVHGVIHAWKPSSSDEPREIRSEGDNRNFLKAHCLAIEPDNTLAATTQSVCLRFKISEQNIGNSHKINTFFNVNGIEDGYCAIQERPSGIWLLDGVNKRDLHLAMNQRDYVMYALDGQNHLVGIGMYPSKGFVLNIDTLERKNFPAISSTITSIVGDPEGGFWLADSFGIIYYMGKDKVISGAFRLDLDHISGSKVYSWPGLVAWMGTCHENTGFGTDVIETIVLFMPHEKGLGTLRKLDTHYFSMAEGKFQTLSYDYQHDHLWTFWANTSRYKLSAKYGTIQEFVSKNVREQEIIDIDPKVFSAAVDTQCIYLLNKNGTLYVIDKQGCNLKAVLSLSTPITQIATEVDQQNKLLLQLGESKLFTCKLMGET